LTLYLFPSTLLLQIVKKGIQSNLLTAYMFHEVDEAVEEIEAGETDPAGGKQQEG
jgi:hypothetical protein